MKIDDILILFIDIRFVKSNEACDDNKTLVKEKEISRYFMIIFMHDSKNEMSRNL